MNIYELGWSWCGLPRFTGVYGQIATIGESINNLTTTMQLGGTSLCESAQETWHDEPHKPRFLHRARGLGSTENPKP